MIPFCKMMKLIFACVFTSLQKCLCEHTCMEENMKGAHRTIGRGYLGKGRGARCGEKKEGR